MAVRAPDFRPDLEWLNTGGRRCTLADFRGRVLVLDFWTYGCINCMHMVPELRAIERRFPATVAVVGVHSGKYPNERVMRNIARACERLGIAHPVVNDRQFRTWREYAVNAWPTLVVVSANGYVLATHRGEMPSDRLTPIIESAIAEAEAAGKLGPTITVTPETVAIPPDPGALRFPAKVVAADNDHLFVADTGHHRVVELSLDRPRARARVVRVIGSGEPGWADGAIGTARFQAPHGLAFQSGRLFVADTENHVVRAVDLGTGQVGTVAGTGAQAQRVATAGGPARAVPLNSPWDLIWNGNALYVAMAGPHQIWRIDIDDACADVFAGSGAEELYDAPLATAALAQPSGLATDGARLYFADSEASAVRWAHPNEGVGTIVGTGLFDFGDRDGVGDDVRLQHPLGLAWWPRRRQLLVADTYNHRIKRIDPMTREVRTVAGSGTAGTVDGRADDAAFWEPGGLTILPDEAHAIVADTNNHRLRMIDLARGRVETVEIVAGP